MPRDRHGERWINREQLADAIGVSPRSISYYVKDGIPHKRRGSALIFPWPRANHWFVAWKSKSRRKEEIELRAADARAELAEWELAEKRGKVVSTAYLEQRIAALAASVRAKLLTFPGRYAAELAGQTSDEVQLVLERGVAEVLRTLQSGPGERAEVEAAS